MSIDQERKHMNIICLYIGDTVIVGNEEDIKKIKEEIKLHFMTMEERDIKENVG